MSHDDLTSRPLDITPASAEPLFTRQSLFCVLLVAGCLLVAWPVVEIGINDDWSYIRTAQLFAQTGHFIYHGWTAPIVGWQAIWGALFVRLFGPGFTAVRLSMVPLDVATVLLYHAVLRRFGLNSSHATFGTLTLVLSPLFFPLAATFMSDIPGLLPIVLCIFLCQRALSASTDRGAWGWLIAAALTNIVLGTARQTAWLGVLVIVPSCGWLLRRRRFVVPLTIGLWLTGIFCIHLTTSWFLRHPYSIPEKIISAPLNLLAFERLLDQGYRGVLTTMLLCTPVLAMGVAALFPLRRRKALRGGVLVLVFVAIVAVLKHYGASNTIAPPWLGTTVDYSGLRGTTERFSPHNAPATGMLLFLLCSALCLWAFLETLDRKHVKTSGQLQIHWRTMSVLVLPLLLSYSVLLMPRSAFADSPEHFLFDRYLLLIFAVVLLALLAWHQDRVSRRVPAVATLALILYAGGTVATTHDFFARERARVRLLDEIQHAGVPRTAIRGGFPFDAVTQVNAWGYVNEPALVNPPGAYHPVPSEQGPCKYWFTPYAPALHPHYEIETQDTTCAAPAPFAPVSYRTWFPPRTLFLWVGTLPDYSSSQPDTPHQYSTSLHTTSIP